MVKNITTKTTSVIMPLSRLAGVATFVLIRSRHFFRSYASSLLKPYRILYGLFPQFPWSILLHFPNYMKFHNLTYLGVDVSMDDMTIPPQTVLNYIFDLHNNAQPIPKNISQHPINQSNPARHPDHSTLHPM